MLRAIRSRVPSIWVGAVLKYPPERGSFTFTTIDEFSEERYRKRGRRRMIAEVAVDYAIPSLSDVVDQVWRASTGQQWTAL